MIASMFTSYNTLAAILLTQSCSAASTLDADRGHLSEPTHHKADQDGRPELRQNMVSTRGSMPTDTTAKVPRLCSFHWCHLLGIMACSCHAGAMPELPLPRKSSSKAPIWDTLGHAQIQESAAKPGPLGLTLRLLKSRQAEPSGLLETETPFALCRLILTERQCGSRFHVELLELRPLRMASSSSQRRSSSNIRSDLTSGSRVPNPPPPGLPP